MNVETCVNMVEERMRLEQVLETADLKTKEDAVKYADALTKIIWDHQMLGLIYEFYDEDVVYKGKNGMKLTKLDDIVVEFVSMISAFPDMRVHITESFASGNEIDGFSVYQRSYCEGTNLGTSKYGPPTGNKLNKDNSFGQTVYVFKKKDNKWKVVNEYSLRSQITIPKLLRNEL